MNHRRRAAALLVAMVGAGTAQGQDAPAPAATRGELLYSVHCVGCHSRQMHWREKRLAVDWPNLQGQVNRWQAYSELGWRKIDIAEVARYLNRTYYHYPGETTAD